MKPRRYDYFAYLVNEAGYSTRFFVRKILHRQIRLISTLRCAYPRVITNTALVVDTFKSEVIAGLRESPKRIPSKFFYDERGSQLFEAITELDEYYLTRTEISILIKYLPEMAARIGPGATIIEFGTGAGVKTKMLLDALQEPRTYIPIDISREQLALASDELAKHFPDLEIHPIFADYTSEISLPVISNGGKIVVFFPGSTIGNFTPEEAIQFLRNVAALIGSEGSLLIGFDRVKDVGVLEAAYNDARGVTAAFNLNLVRRIQKEFETAISEEDFEHYSFFNTEENRVEMHLVSKRSLTVCFGSEEIHFDKGEHIITEYSYKYTPAAFNKILTASGFEVQDRWSDEKEFFEECYATVHK
jgi:dimethylhistidine N-methyltransferase